MRRPIESTAPDGSMNFGGVRGRKPLPDLWRSTLSRALDRHCANAARPPMMDILEHPALTNRSFLTGKRRGYRDPPGDVATAALSPNGAAFPRTNAHSRSSGDLRPAVPRETRQASPAPPLEGRSTLRTLGERTPAIRNTYLGGETHCVHERNDGRTPLCHEHRESSPTR